MLRTQPTSPGSVPWLIFYSAVHRLAARATDVLKKYITRNEWEKKLKDVNITKEDMNKLVMNFLLIEGYVEAAEKFQMETGSEHIDLATIRDRMAVKKTVQCGDVEDAIEKIVDLNPEILNTNPELVFHIQQLRLIKLIRRGKEEEEAIVFAQEVLAPLGEQNQTILKEFERTFALLAFKDVSKCPTSEFLETQQHLKTANEVNAAILASQGHEKEPKLPSLLKMLIWVQNQLREKAEYPWINNLSTAVLEDPVVFDPTDPCDDSV